MREDLFLLWSAFPWEGHSANVLFRVMRTAQQCIVVLDRHGLAHVLHEGTIAEVVYVKGLKLKSLYIDLSSVLIMHERLSEFIGFLFSFHPWKHEVCAACAMLPSHALCVAA